MILTIDIGTTNLKAGLFTTNGKMKNIIGKETQYSHHPSGYTYIDPEILWRDIQNLIQEILEDFSETKVQAISITSMAESGLLLNEKTGKPLSNIIPWFETSSISAARLIEKEIDNFAVFQQTGLRISYKYGLSKLLWMKDKDPSVFGKGSVWLSVSAFIAYCLTGQIVEEKTLALRTFVYRMDQENWNDDLIKYFGLQKTHFPERVISCFESCGTVTSDNWQLGLSKDTEVYIAGHDHIVSAVAAGVISPGEVYNSIGTAETLVGLFPKRELTREDFDSGLSFGLFHIDDFYFWMGGHSSSGGSVEWIRKILGNQSLSYDEIMTYLEEANPGPTALLFYPYLNGSGAPYVNPEAKGAFFGLTNQTGKADLIKAVLEGNSYQMELIREVAEKITETKINRIITIGGGVRNHYWLQIKADVSGVQLSIPNISEAGLYGAALITATSEGYYANLKEAIHAQKYIQEKTINPQPERVCMYREIYEDQYKALVIQLFSQKRTISK